MLPPLALRNADLSPFQLRQQSEGAAAFRVVQRLVDKLEERLGEDDVSVFINVIVIFV